MPDKILLSIKDRIDQRQRRKKRRGAVSQILTPTVVIFDDHRRDRGRDYRNREEDGPLLRCRVGRSGESRGEGQCKAVVSRDIYLASLPPLPVPFPSLPFPSLPYLSSGWNVGTLSQDPNFQPCLKSPQNDMFMSCNCFSLDALFRIGLLLGILGILFT